MFEVVLESSYPGILQLFRQGNRSIITNVIMTKTLTYMSNIIDIQLIESNFFVADRSQPFISAIVIDFCLNCMSFKAVKLDYQHGRKLFNCAIVYRTDGIKLLCSPKHFKLHLPLSENFL